MPSPLQLRREAQAVRLENACREALRRNRGQERDRRAMILEALDRQIVGSKGLPRYVDEIVIALLTCPGQQHREAFRKLVLRMETVADRLLDAGGALGGNRYLAGLHALAGEAPHWRRSLEAWHPASKSPGRQFAQLARYLLAKYPVPAFVDTVFFTPPARVCPSWFRHLGGGGSLRTAPELTAALTRRMAHHALLAPDGCDMIQAIRWGQVLGLGGSPRLARAVWGTRLGHELSGAAQEAFWITALRWLVRQPLLEPVHVGPILDYVTARWRDDRRFSMSGRTAAALLRRVEDWHAEVDRAARIRARSENADLPASGFQAGIWEVSAGIWTVEEVCSTKLLAQEGSEMRHCVATYEAEIQIRYSSIWSMKVERCGVTQRAVTIEVCNPSRSIVQVRGKYNRCPTEEEQRILERWARENGLLVRV